jgi:hypothetical protein
MTPPSYDTFSQKDRLFSREQIDDFAALMARLRDLKLAGFYFRGQRDAGWKLYSWIQREWIQKDELATKLSSVADFNEQHLRYQQEHAARSLTEHTRQRNDLADLSGLQHYGAPTPFLDFTSEIDSALFFATDGMASANDRETSQRVSIYAWKPGSGPATASHNDMTNWETVVDNSGCIDGAVSLHVLCPISVIYIKQDSGKFLQIANDRIDLQNGLFVYSPKAIREGMPYEELFTGMTIDDVVDDYHGLFIPKMLCLDVDKGVAAKAIDYVRDQGVSKESLGLASGDWARDTYDAFLKMITG